MRKFFTFPRVILALGALCFGGCVFYLLSYDVKNESVDSNSDEIIHIRVTQEMLHSGDLFNPTHGGAPYFNKPPLKMWLSLPAIALLGESNLSYRLVDILAGTGVCLLTLLISKTFFGSFLPGLFACLMFAASKELILGVHGFRRGTQDALLLFFVCCAQFYSWKLASAFFPKTEQYASARTRKYQILLGVFVGLAVFTKSVAGLLPLILHFAFVLLACPRETLKSALKASVMSLLIAIAIPSLYFLPHCLWSDGAWQRFFYMEVIERAVHGMHNIEKPLFYFRELFLKTSLTSGMLVAVASLALAFIAKRRNSKELLFLLLWAWLPVVLYSIPRSRLPWYIFPALPALALLSGVFVVYIFRYAFENARGNRNPVGIFKAVLSLAIGVILVYPIIKSTTAVAQSIFTTSEKNRIQLDTITRAILKAPSGTKALIFPDAIPKEANPRRGQFNVEGIYRHMLSTRAYEPASEADFSERLATKEYPIILIPLSKYLATTPRPLLSSYAVAERYKFRKEALLAFTSIDAVSPAEFQPTSRVLPLGKSSPHALFGFGSEQALENRHIRFIYGARAGIVLPIDSLLRQTGLHVGLVLGYNAPHRKTNVRFKITLNETLIASGEQERNSIASHEFSIPPEILEPANNVLNLSFRFSDDTIPNLKDQLLFIEKLTLSPNL